MRTWLFTCLKLLWGIYLALTSAYCLLAFLPYTYFALIKAPAYEWIPWFTHHQAILYAAALLSVGIATWLSSANTQRNSRAPIVIFAALGVSTIYIAARPFLPSLENNWSAYRWSLAALLPLTLVAILHIRQNWPENEPASTPGSLYPYPPAVFVAAFIALFYAAGSLLHKYIETRSFTFGNQALELAAWSMFTHVVVAIIVVSILNGINIVSWRTARPGTSRFLLIAVSLFALVWVGLAGFFSSALTFEGWPSHLYAASLAAALTLFATSLVLPFLSRSRGTLHLSRPAQTIGLLLASTFLSLLAVLSPTLIAGGDWNGVLQRTFTLFFWMALSACAYLLRPGRRNYSPAAIMAVLVLALFAYKSLLATDIFWAKPLGPTEDDVARSMETYAAGDASFQLAHHILGNERDAGCGDLCRILRQHTNIRDTEAKTELKLVDSLAPTAGPHPNIFIWVIDSLRPDYLGAYNPQVDFTPHLDAFARDSSTIHNAYTQYMGTTLSEPAIWAGAMLLHTHYLRPFSKVNSLEKLAAVDGYQMMVSFDTVLTQILSPTDNAIKLDTAKTLWNQYEACSTTQQLEAALDGRSDSDRPVLFYAQPMNVHQFARNNMPGPSASHWRLRPGFNNRVAFEVNQVDECLGGFFAYLKAHGLYDSSIIILTSDHGDATGEFGRFSHSTTIYPEIIRVPLLIHLPRAMQSRHTHDDSRLSTLTDITPTLYYLLGHRPIVPNPLFGQPIFVERKDEWTSYPRQELFLASDVHAAYGILAENGRYLYTTYDAPAQSMLFDLSRDPNAQHDLLDARLKTNYDERIIQHLHAIADFYGYKPGVGSLLAANH